MKTSLIVAITITAFAAPALLPGASPLPSRIAFGSCAQPRVKQPVWSTVLAADPDLFVFCGDAIYASGRNAADFTELYGLLAANGDFPKVREKIPILATWDDHDYGANDAGAANPMKAEAKAAFLKFFDVPADSPRRTREGIYDSAMFEAHGRKLQVILLDTRWFRSDLVVAPPEKRFDKGRYAPNNDPAATILGEAQWKWLGDQLRQPADVRLLVSSIQIVADQHGFEKWANFPHERRRLFELIRETAAGGVIALSGDRHFSEISKLPAQPEGLGYPLYDVTASALNQAGSLIAEPNRNRTSPVGYGAPNFGMIEIRWADADPTLVFEIRDALTGNSVIKETVNLSMLQADGDSKKN